MYLTGINQFKVILLLDPTSKESDEILFIGSKDPTREFWDGVRFGVGDDRSIAEVKKVTGIKDVRNIDTFKEVLQQRLKKQRSKRLGTFWMEGNVNGSIRNFTNDHNWVFRQKLAGWLRGWGYATSALKNVMHNHFDLRLPLDRYDVANTARAQEITGKAFKETLQNFKKFKTEYQVQGFIEGQMTMGSPYGLSFPSIIASGPNATVLHYMKNDDAFSKDEMVLLDFGVRWMTMHADISRTVPASGKFNPLQKMLYEIVLKAQREVEKRATEGETISRLNDLCWDVVNDGLKNRFEKAGGKYKTVYNERPHGVSHLIGEQEHDGDPFRNYATQPMKSGWLISNEPGVYGEFKIRLEGKLYEEAIGIRLEDNLLIQKVGCVNLSRNIPKSVKEIERIMAK